MTTSAYITIHNMVNAMIDTFGTAAQKEEHCTALCSMDKLASYCLTEPGTMVTLCYHSNAILGQASHKCVFKIVSLKM